MSEPFKQSREVVDTYLKLGWYEKKDGKIIDRFNKKEIIVIEEGNNLKTNTEDNANENYSKFLNKKNEKQNLDALDLLLLSNPFTGPLGQNRLIDKANINKNLKIEEEKNELDAAQTFASQQKEIKKKRLARYGKRRQGGILRYPAELLTEHADYLQIDIERYAEIGTSYVNKAGASDRYVTGNRRTNAAGRSSRLSRKPLINAGTILLPIPAQLQDTNNVVYGESRMNGLAAAGVSALEGAMREAGQQIAQNKNLDLSGETEKFKTELQSGLGKTQPEALNTAADLLTKKLAAEAVNIFGANVTPNQLLARGNGEILNPNMELLFSDVTIRNFRFSFKLTPRNAKEAEQVKLIIRAFKRNMAPQAQGGVSDGSNFFLRTPNVFKLRYRSGNKNHPFLNRFKQCFLTDMQTTYTADGVYSVYEDGTPVSMQLDLSFKELQPIYDVDYDERPGSEAVGY